LKEIKDFLRILFTPSEIDSGFGVFDFGVKLIFVKPQNPGLSLSKAIVKALVSKYYCKSLLLSKFYFKSPRSNFETVLVIVKVAS